MFNYYAIGVEQCIQKFLDVARQTECFFLQKRLQLAVQKPEQVIKEVESLFNCLWFYYLKVYMESCEFLMQVNTAGFNSLLSRQSYLVTYNFHNCNVLQLALMFLSLLWRECKLPAVLLQRLGNI